MIYHKNLALDGLFPGLVTHRSVANLGTFEIEITVEPIYDGGGGGGGYYFPRKDKYKVKIRVTRNGKLWELEQVVNSITAKVICKLLRIKQEDSAVTLTSSTLSENKDPVIEMTFSAQFSLSFKDISYPIQVSKKVPYYTDYN